MGVCEYMLTMSRVAYRRCLGDVHRQIRYASTVAVAPPRKFHKHFARTKRDQGGVASRMDVFEKEMCQALEQYNNTKGQALKMEDVFIPRSLAEERATYDVENVEILYHTSSGDGLGLVSREYIGQAGVTVVRVPKTIPGDVVDVQIHRHQLSHAEARLVRVKRQRRTRRNDRLIVCDKFHECSGCQLQMMSHTDQMKYKQRMLRRAYEFFYPELVAEYDARGFGYMVELPMQYAYRTKITPHFQLRRGVSNEQTSIGFNNVDDPVGVVDVDWCAIATPAINAALPALKAATRDRLVLLNANAMLQRERMRAKVAPTLLLRNSIRIDHNTGEYDHVCLTGQHKVVTEQVGEFVFQFESNEFFQNNASILPLVLEYVAHHIKSVDFKHIVDTYCGSGFFGISLSKYLPENGRVFGIELSEKAIKYAKHNAHINGLLVPDKIDFLSGDSASLFKHPQFVESDISGDNLVVIMDPSRKGSNEDYLKQLLEFAPKLVVYVSCNPFSQARDLRTLAQLEGPVQYDVVDVAGFDFFPQTKHVESVAILRRRQTA